MGRGCGRTSGESGKSFLGLQNDSTSYSFASTIHRASKKMLNRLYPAEPEGHWRT
jgi:hypothetical protein